MMDYNYKPFDDDEEMSFLDHKYALVEYEDEQLNFLNQQLSSMGRGIPANFMQADDATQLRLINEAKDNPLAQFGDDFKDWFDYDNVFDQIQKEPESSTNCDVFLNNNPFYTPSKLTKSDLETQQKINDDAKKKFIHNDLRKMYSVNERFIIESEITELLRSCNIYSINKSHLCSKNTLVVPKVIINPKLKSTIPYIFDDNFFKFNDTPPTIQETFDIEYLEAKYKCKAPLNTSSSSSSSESPNSESSTSSSTSTSLSSPPSEKPKCQESKVFSAKDIYLMKRKKKRGTTILSTSNNFKL